MTKQKKYFIISVVIFLILTLGIILLYKNRKDPNLKNYLSEDAKIMDTMMKEMNDIPRTGDASLSFLYGMIPHHESAVDMSQIYLKYGGENEELKKIAEDIIDVQVSEIEHMNQLISEIEKNIQIDTDKENAYFKEYNKTNDHNMSHQTFKNVEEAFANGMITHHQMAIDMSEAILKYTNNDTIRTMAENIISAQKVEINQMENILKSIK